jgi:hypothetical protein
MYVYMSGRLCEYHMENKGGLQKDGVLVASGFPAMNLAHVDLARGGHAHNSMAAVSADGSTICDALRGLFMLQSAVISSSLGLS